MTTFPRTTLFVAALLTSAAVMSGAAFAQAPAAAAPAGPPAAQIKPAVPQTTPIVIKDTGLAGSQSIRYDLFYDRYIIANDGAAGAGYISTVTGDGKLDQLKFIAGGVNGADLTDPTGVYVRNGVLFVADRAKGVRVFDLTSGKQTASYAIPGAIALTGIAATADGNIYVSDNGNSADTGAIYKIDANGKVTKIASGAALKRPGGLDINSNLLDKPGGSATITYVTTAASDFVRIDQTGKELSRTDLKVGNLTGLAYTDDGWTLVSAADGTAYVLDPYNKPTKLQTGLTGAAGIGWDWVRNKTLVAEPSTGVVVLPGPKVPGFPGT